MPKEEKEENILVAQIDALIQNLDRIYNLLQNDKIEPEFRNPIYGKFGLAINTRKYDLEKLKERVEGKNLTGAQLAEEWKKYTDVRVKGQRVFDQCLDFLGGVAVRRMELEEGICSLAEDLVKYFAERTGVSWSSVMILGEERPFDDVAQLTQIIRLQFPEWDIWSLPFTAYEFGQLVARAETLTELFKFFVDEEELIRQLIEKENLTEEEFINLAPDIKAHRQEYQSDKTNTRLVERFLEQQRVHMRGLFADAFATYFLGPAYLYARLYLRLIPTDVLQEEPHKPSLGRRIFFMLETLEKMNDAQKTGPYDTGPYYTEIQRIKGIWSKTIAGVAPGYRFGKPYDDWFAKMYSNLEKNYRGVGLKAQAWKEATELGKRLLDDSAGVPPGTSLPVILNAAWYCRFNHPDRRVEIAKAARKLCDAVRGGKPGLQGPAAPQR